MDDRKPILSLDKISKTFHSGRSKDRRVVWALRDISLNIYHGECLALVGESGSGKTTLARCLVRRYLPDSGTIRFRDEEISKHRRQKQRASQQKIQLIAQNHYQALNPRMSIAETIMEPLRAIRQLSAAEAEQELKRLIDIVELPMPVLARYPRQLSGGQQQRVVIARALAMQPDCLIADEPTANLDVRLKRKILDLFKQLQMNLQLTLLLITHDMSAALYLADRIAVMRHGEIRETMITGDINLSWQDSYSRQLLAASLPNTLSAGEI